MGPKLNPEASGTLEQRVATLEEKLRNLEKGQVDAAKAVDRVRGGVSKLAKHVLEVAIPKAIKMAVDVGAGVFGSRGWNNPDAGYERELTLKWLEREMGDEK